jgi:hypothetical protein
MVSCAIYPNYVTSGAISLFLSDFSRISPFLFGGIHSHCAMTSIRKLDLLSLEPDMLDESGLSGWEDSFAIEWMEN